MICDHDCFHCKFADCVLPGNVITREESEIMKGAHGGWDFENKAALFIHMRENGMNISQIVLGLDITDGSLQKVKRKAARLRQQAKAART